MALINTFPTTVNNKITSSGLTIRYESTLAGTPSSGYVYKVTRRATKNYSYVGMTISAARSCEAAMLDKYYRKLAKWEYSDGEILPNFVFGSAASITIIQTEGDNYTVEVSVSEEDEIYTTIEATTVNRCRRAFAFAEVRDYDEDSPAFVGLAIVIAYFDEINQRISISYATNIANFDTSKLQIQWYNELTNVWSTITSAYAIDGNTISAASIRRAKYRLRYNVEPAVLSNEASPVVDPQKNEIFLKRAVNDVLSTNTQLEYQYNGASIEWWNYIDVEWYDEIATTWKTVPLSKIRNRGAVLFIIEMLDGEHHSYRLRWHSGAAEVFSNAVVSTGDALSDYSVVLSSAVNKVDDFGRLVTEVNFTSNLSAPWLRRNDVYFKISDELLSSLETAEKIVATSTGWTATLDNVAILDTTQTVQFLFGELANEDYLLKSNMVNTSNDDSAVVTTITLTDITANESVAFNNVSTTAGSVTFDWGDGTVETVSTNPSHTYTAAGDYTVKMTNVDTLGNNFIGELDEKVTAAKISGKVIEIGSYAFSGSALETVGVPRAVQVFGGAFYNGSSEGSLTKAYLHSVTELGPNLFSGNPNLTDVTIGQTIATVQAMTDYPFGIPTGATIHCTDGDIVIE